MKVVIVALALVALAAAIPVEKAPSEPVEIIKFENEQTPGQGYRFEFETNDGTSRQEEGTLKDVPDAENKIHPVIVVRGTYTYINDKGEPEKITYEGDQDGYRAYGESIPKQASRR